MGSGLGIYLCGELLDHVFGGNTGGNAYTAPTKVYIALGTDATPDYTTFTELSIGANAYARVEVANTDVYWDAHTDSTNTATKTSGGSGNNAFTFPTNTTSDWGTVRSWAIYDAASGGNQLAFGELTVDKTITVGDTASFADGALTVSLKAANA